ncbi:malate dehydrogenase (quinone) [Asaia bogorensis]|uniref:Probable malate:quinone oxidoreductase n=1 Tax=Asaia bogorensis NBRC 16594 TaxID=1231624 RepID=A0AAN4R474_9PROT|nr:malate dehydrogenase (quinone) [Asaia bogorensis]BAT19454.1 malate:quinone oxidoreductase [Asaia bogorensis NBRC 16594]GBQ81739.1 malate:quinone oxidoreductase [Asaia bogorensis NBRC 16594]GEL54050.1 putative malate:quinone oxidoreductase [Asaia bogorensis NBRC 16594]
MSQTCQERPDIVLIGAGVMSASFAALIRSLDPSLTISVFEALDSCAKESSEAWNNAGTGHAAYCELNYTTRRPDGSIDMAKALDVNTEFDLSRQLWAHLVEKGWITDPSSFIRRCPHMSFVRGEENVAFLRARYETMVRHHCFDTMAYSEDAAQIAEWAPLMMARRRPGETLAATRVEQGTDVDFGTLTRTLFNNLRNEPGIDVHYRHKVTALDREGRGTGGNPRWRVSVQNTETGETRTVSAGFVFVGAGGAALELLKGADLPEAHGYAGFPVSGLFLHADNLDLCQRHTAKVYGKAAVGSPPMSVPHLDTRIIGGRPYLLFGPYAGFTTKFLKSGRWTDLPRSITTDNARAMFDVMVDNRDLVRYLIGQVLQKPSSRFAALQDFYPSARQHDWRVAVAGQRVQIIKRENGRGTLKFGTEVLSTQDHSLAAVLGASPGASIAASVALKVVQQNFASRLPEWRTRLEAIIPSYGLDLRKDESACRRIREQTGRVLGI